MADNTYDDVFAAMRGGESPDGIPIEDIIGAARNDRSSNDISSVLQTSAGQAQTAAPAPAPTKKAAAPSQSMADANAFIRANRDSTQVAALLKPTGGAAAVNANTDSYGVRADVDENGNIVLTNIGVTAKNPVYSTGPGGVGPGSGSIAPNTPTSVGGLYNNLTKSTDVDEARGIAASLRNAAAIEQSKYEQQSIQFAENQLGVPRLNQELQAAMAADMADPRYAPGMGDSPRTAAIRTTLEDARGRALTNSKVLLNNNPSYAVLKSTMISAESEVQRISRIGERKEIADANIKARGDDRQWFQDQKAIDDYNTLDATMKNRVLTLNPELKNMQPDDLSIQGGKIVSTRAKADKAYAAAIQAPEATLPALALNGNNYATTLVVSKESANTGTPATEVQARLDSMRMRALNPKFDEEAKAYFGQDKKGQDDYKKYIENLNAKGLDATGKAEKAALKYQVVLEMEKKKTTIQFRNQLDSWKVDTETANQANSIFPGASALFDDAVKQTRKVTQGSKLVDVFNQYLGDSVAEERISRAKAFSALMQGTARQKQDSIFGVPDARALQTQLNSEVSKNAISRWMTKANERLIQSPDHSDGSKPKGFGFSRDIPGAGLLDDEAPIELYGNTNAG